MIRRRLALAGLIALLPATASAQIAFIAPTVPVNDSSDKIANTAWVAGLLAAGVVNLTVTGNLTVNGVIIDGNGQLLTNIAAPATPAAGTTRVYTDLTQKVLTFKNDAGVVGNAVVPSTAGANQFANSISAAGVIGYAQPTVSNIGGFGTGVATALGVNTGSAGAPVLFNGAGGTPSSLTLTNATGLPTTGLTGTTTAAQEPAHTGDVTNSAGSLALTLAAGNAGNLNSGTLLAARLPSNSIWIGRQTFCASGCTATGGTYTPTAGTNEVLARCVGGGGGSGGAATTGAGQNAIATSGGGGGYAEGRFTTSFSGVTVTIGAGGTAGTAGNNPGGAGGATTFGALMTANGGGNGVGGAAAASPGGLVTGASGGTASGGDINFTGQASDSVVYILAAAARSSSGGASPWGYGGQSQATATAVAGIAGSGHGAGASGAAVAASSTQQAGAAGAGGMCIVDEFR